MLTWVELGVWEGGGVQAGTGRRRFLWVGSQGEAMRTYWSFESALLQGTSMSE